MSWGRDVDVDALRSSPRPSEDAELLALGVLLGVGVPLVQARAALVRVRAGEQLATIVADLVDVDVALLARADALVLRCELAQAEPVPVRVRRERRS